MISSTHRLVISQLSFKDAEFILELVNTPGWLKYIGDRHIHSVSQAESYLETGPLKNYQEYGFGLYRISLKESNSPAGICGLLQRDYLEHPDLGFAFLPKFEGKGYAFEAAQAVLEQEKMRGKLKQIYAITTPENQRSHRLLKKLGFNLEEEFVRQHERLIKYSHNCR